MQGDDKELATRARARLFIEYPKMTAESRAEVRDTAAALEDAVTKAKLELREARITQEARGEGASA